jgi:hypothetical protein
MAKWIFTILGFWKVCKCMFPFVMTFSIRIIIFILILRTMIEYHNAFDLDNIPRVMNPFKIVCGFWSKTKHKFKGPLNTKKCLIGFFFGIIIF